jgi:Co/Zn/Cd efflux system component
MSKVQLLSRVLVLSLMFCVVEVVGGYFSGSLSVIADAVHLLLVSSSIVEWVHS